MMLFVRRLLVRGPQHLVLGKRDIRPDLDAGHRPEKRQAEGMGRQGSHRTLYLMLTMSLTILFFFYHAECD